MTDKRRSIPEPKRRKARDLLNAGLTIAQVSKQAGVSYAGVIGIARSFGIEVRRSRVRGLGAAGGRGDPVDFPIAPVPVVQNAILALGRRA